MNKTFLWNAFLNSPQFLGAPAAARGWWVCLQRHCSEQETSGVVRGARAFSATHWTMVLGAGGGIGAIDRIVAVGLAQWSGEDLLVSGYHIDSEKSYQAKRTIAGRGGKAKAEKDRREREKKDREDRERRDQPEEPGFGGLGSGSGTGSATTSATGSAVAHKERRGEESRGLDSWGRGGEGEEGEGEGSMVSVPLSVPESPSSMVTLFKALHETRLGAPYIANPLEVTATLNCWNELEPTELPERITTYLLSRGPGASISDS